MQEQLLLLLHFLCYSLALGASPLGRGLRCLRRRWGLLAGASPSAVGAGFRCGWLSCRVADCLPLDARGSLACGLGAAPSLNCPLRLPRLRLRRFFGSAGFAAGSSGSAVLITTSSRTGKDSSSSGLRRFTLLPEMGARSSGIGGSFFRALPLRRTQISSCL